MNENQVTKSTESEVDTMVNSGLPVKVSESQNSPPGSHLAQGASGPSNICANSDSARETVSVSAPSFSRPKITATGTYTHDGKLIKVQQANSNTVLVGTLVRPLPKGQDVIPHKVLLTSMKQKDSSPMARLILPRPPPNSTQTSPAIPKQYCKPIHVIPCSQGTLIPSNITVKTTEGASKILQPTIIRQRPDGKLIATSGSSLTSGIIVPGKSPPPHLTLIKSMKPQSLIGERKLVVLDVKEKDKSLPEPAVEPQSLKDINTQSSENEDPLSFQKEVIDEGSHISAEGKKPEEKKIEFVKKYVKVEELLGKNIIRRLDDKNLEKFSKTFEKNDEINSVRHNISEVTNINLTACESSEDMDSTHQSKMEVSKPVRSVTEESTSAGLLSPKETSAVPPLSPLSNDAMTSAHLTLPKDPGLGSPPHLSPSNDGSTPIRLLSSKETATVPPILRLMSFKETGVASARLHSSKEVSPSSDRPIKKISLITSAQSSPSKEVITTVTSAPDPETSLSSPKEAVVNSAQLPQSKDMTTSAKDSTVDPPPLLPLLKDTALASDNSPPSKEVPSALAKEVSLSPAGREKSTPNLTPALHFPVPPLVLRESVTSVPKEPAPTSEGRARKRKGSLNMAVSSPSKTRAVLDSYDNMRILPGAEELSPFQIIKWDEHGLGELPNSDIQVVLNEFGMIEINASLKQLEKTRHGKIDDAEEIFCCVQCRCYGLISEFFNESFCSVSCRDDLNAQQLALVNLEDLEPLEYSKDKKKSDHTDIRKSLLMNEMSKNMTKFPSNNKTSDVEVVNLVEDDEVTEDSAPNTDESSPRSKKTANVDSGLNKVKKMSKTNKSSGKGSKLGKPGSSASNTGSLSPVSARLTQDNTNKSKIKLRPRTGVKIHRYADEEVAQDLFVGSPSSDKSDTSKKYSEFRWSTYIYQTKSTPAWVKLFPNPYPSKPNRFKVGQRLEAIDPEHQSYFCLVSVAEIKGYRLKLHFDGYPPEYDFWVNADSPNIFPPEFCMGHRIPLHPPPGIPIRSFEWNSYLSRNNARAAPASLFDTSFLSSHTNLFKVDMKLEAVDRKNTFLVCVSTVAAVMDNRILIHFDSWGDLYDYWIDISSPYIRPVGWCQKNGHELTPPNGIKAENFSWKRYLKDTKSVAAPEKAFSLRPPIEFKKGMKLEAVDKRAPHLVRVASISAVLPYQVHITFDGFPAHFGYWVDDDCADIHPVGWSSRCGHPIQPPPDEEDFLNAACKTPGCLGQGFLRGTKRETHTKPEDCPFLTEHLTKDTALTDRLKWSSVKFKNYGNDFCTIPDDSDEEESDEDIENIRWSWLKVRQDLNKSAERLPEEKTVLKPKIKTVKKKNHKPKTRKSRQNSVDNKVESPPDSGELRGTAGSSTDCVEDPTELKKIFGPSSPIPLEDLIERESSFEPHATDYDESGKTDEKGNKLEIKSEPMVVVEDKLEEDIVMKMKEDIVSSTADVEIKQEKTEPVDVNSTQLSNSTDNCDIKVKEENNAIIKDEIKEEFVDDAEDKQLVSDQNKLGISAQTEITSVNSFLPHRIKEDVKGVPESNALDSMVSSEGPEYRSTIEENNPLRWTISEVSQFTKPLLPSCSQDCFLKEGIDGAGFLMLNKNDLLDYLGLSDSDAETIWNKISMLRQRVQ